MLSGLCSFGLQSSKFRRLYGISAAQQTFHIIMHMQGVYEVPKSCGNGVKVTVVGLSNWKPLAGTLHTGVLNVMIMKKLKMG